MTSHRIRSSIQFVDTLWTSHGDKTIPIEAKATVPSVTQHSEDEYLPPANEVAGR